MNEYRFDEIQLGMTVEFDAVIDMAMQQSFTQISGDLNPLHLDREFAISRGFDGIVVYGMLTSALYSRLVGMYLPGKHCLFHEIHIFFNRPVYIGEKLRLSAKVVEKNEIFKRIKIKAAIANEAGQKKSLAQLTVGVA